MKATFNFMAEELAALETEARNPNTLDLDQLSTFDLIQRLHQENYEVAAAVNKTLPAISALVDLVASRLSANGRLIYVGAGTSGRLGVLDASECPPTFGVSKNMVQGVIAGGESALTNSIEGAEDDASIGRADLTERNITANDVVVGIAASGRTPYVSGALRYARECGAFTAVVVNVSVASLSNDADITIAAITGAEALTGSSRLKAGTAQKLILNLISTAAMVKMGKTYSNLMVDVRASNFKLRNRAVRIVCAATGVDLQTAEANLTQADWNAKTAIVMLLAKVDAAEASIRLECSGGWVRNAISPEL